MTVVGITGPAFTRLYDEAARDLHRYLAVRSDPVVADDLVAETFLIAWQQRDRYQPTRGSARAWLYGIATNLFRHHARGELRAQRAMARSGGRAESADELDTVVAHRADASTQARKLAGGLADLRDEERDVLLLVALAGLKPVEVAHALDVPVATVRTRLHRARATLRSCVTEEDPHA